MENIYSHSFTNAHLLGLCLNETKYNQELAPLTIFSQMTP